MICESHGKIQLMRHPAARNNVVRYHQTGWEEMTSGKKENVL